MITILVLKNGDEIIGETVVFEDYLEVIEPMHIIDSELGMKLQDALLLSDSIKLIFKIKDVITYYVPNKVMIEYYSRAVEYAIKHTRPKTIKQITYAIKDIDEMMQQDLTPDIKKVSGTATIH